MVRAALTGALARADYETDPVFGLSIPTQIESVPDEVLKPRGTWSDGAAYDTQAKKLADMFRSNFEQFEQHVSEAVLRAGPHGAG